MSRSMLALVLVSLMHQQANHVIFTYSVQNYLFMGDYVDRGEEAPPLRPHLPHLHRLSLLGRRLFAFIGGTCSAVVSRRSLHNSWSDVAVCRT